MASGSRKRPRASTGDATGLSPITFTLPGLQADTRLLVFDQEYRVHSLILKLHSAYFRQFLDSPDKIPASENAPFKYDYVSVVDEDGSGWALQPANKAQVSTTSREYGHEKEPFRKLLCAMYNRPYQIKNTGELKILANLADFYCALPIVSATLTAAMLGSPMVKREINPGGPIGHEISDNSVELIIVAKKLRHAVLYRECFIHLVGLWPPGHPDLLSQPEIDLLKRDKRLWRLLSDGYANLNQRILKVHHKLLNLVLRRTISFHALVELLPGRLMTDPQESADAFRTLRIELAKLRAEVNMSGNVNLEELSTLVDDLMVNNLVLDQTGYDVGEGPFETIFLCADIGDEVMPWDSEETDY